MPTSNTASSVDKLHRVLRPHDRKLWPAVAALAALALFLSTLQTGINGSVDAYATDVGEIQNALPRWGLIHRSGYPLYTAGGSLFVTLLRPLGIEPAAGASLFSALWGALYVGLLVLLAQELDVSGPAAALGVLATALSTSVWVFGSLAEVHTLTLVFSVLILLYALRFGRSGARRDLLLLILFSSQGVMHQRSAILLAPAALVLAWPHLRTLWRNVLPALGVALLAPLTYLYMPFRVWTGATWVFGSPGTWDGFWEMLFDNRAARVVRTETSPAEWLERLRVTLRILGDDMFWPLIALGLASLLLLALHKKGRRAAVAMTLAWIPNLALTWVIWRGRVVDAQLAAKLPIVVLAGLGLALILDRAYRWSPPAGVIAAGALVVTLGFWGARTRPFVLSITRDPTAEGVIETVERMSLPPDGRRATLVSTWGLDYWALAYAQECQGRLPGLNLVDHNADLKSLAERGDHILILAKILHVFPVSRWEHRLGPLYLSSAAPGVIELSPTPPLTPADVPADIALDMENGLQIRSAAVTWAAPDRLQVTVYWEVLRAVEQNFSCAVHLLARDPPQSGEDILSQADTAHPVDGWYPTSQWQAGEIVRDCHDLPVPAGSSPVAVRVALYRSDPEAGFVNSPWLTLPVPAR
jgi:hypothetical protein